MLNRLLKFPLLLALPTAVSAQICTNPIYEGSSNGYSNVGGATIGQIDGKMYAIDHLCNGKFHKFLLQVEISRLNGIPKWKTLDVLFIPVGSDNFEIVFGESSYCKLNGELDPELVCLAVVTQEDFWTSTKTWRANRSKGKFQALRKGKVTCGNPGYGV